MENQWDGFDDFELACLCHGYGIEEECQFASILPVVLANRKQIETLLTEFEFELAFGE